MKSIDAAPHIRSAAVVGSGTLGGGIAALLAGVGIPTLLLGQKRAKRGHRGLWTRPADAFTRLPRVEG